MGEKVWIGVLVCYADGGGGCGYGVSSPHIIPEEISDDLDKVEEFIYREVYEKEEDVFDGCDGGVVFYIGKIDEDLLKDKTDVVELRNLAKELICDGTLCRLSHYDFFEEAKRFNHINHLKICPKCGYPNEPDETLCISCGESLS